MNEILQKHLLSVQKPSRYIGGEYGQKVKNRQEIDVRFAFCFPDVYDIGMSNLAMQILYGIINSRPNMWCERAFAPWQDFEEILRKENIPLCALESGDKLADFDFLGFTLAYELSYTNILNMLDLSGIPLYSAERDERYPLVIGGGGCACNSAPILRFFDLFVIGDGEEVTIELLELYVKNRQKNYNKFEFLREAAQLEGVYVPSLKNHTTKRIMLNLDNMYSPSEFVVPYGEIVHERASVEVLRGCIRGCRFCQAGFLYRPYREKSCKTICEQAQILCENTGYDELSLISLSTSDHNSINQVLENLLNFTDSKRVNLSMPSMRIDAFSDTILEKISGVRKSTLTFAPEAGTQRLRDVINKNITEPEILKACETAFRGGYSNVKLYFMLGLPTENDDDILGISTLAQKIEQLYYQTQREPNAKCQKGAIFISISCATFVPKPFTPFQFEPQCSPEEILRKQSLLREAIKSKKVKISTHSPEVSVLEAALARGDEKLGAVIHSAWKNGAKFDAWDDFFDYEKWLSAFAENGLTPEYYSQKTFEYDEKTPWDNINFLIEKDFLIRENKRAKSEKTTPNCREQCSACGVKCSRKKSQEDIIVKIDINKCEKNQHYEPNHVFYPVRVVFTKIGSIVLISHLDMVRAINRAIKRSGLPVKYTEGFNPHYSISFPMALPLGVESVCEIMDFKLENFVDFKKVKNCLNNALPNGIKCLEVSNQILNFAEIAFSEYEVKFSQNFDLSKWDDFIAQNEIIIKKKSKKAKVKGGKIVVSVDIKPDIQTVEKVNNVLKIRLPSSITGGISPTAVMRAFVEFLQFEPLYKIKKVKLLQSNLANFR